MKFREQRGTLEESMKTLVELKDKSDLVRHCTEILSKVLLGPSASQLSELEVTHYGSDSRIGWDQVYIVTLKGWGVIGFTDSPN